MTPTDIDPKIVTQRAAWVLEMIDALRDLPLKNKEDFLRNRNNVAAAESYLRRSLEALFDIGRHILAKRFAFPATEYKEIARGLLDKKILNEEEADLMRKMAGYRNRMVHFYHEIMPEELHEICRDHLDEIKLLLDRMLRATPFPRPEEERARKK
jgi:uncharacterized protein YutE (UPF0331/DUF86 family)